MCTFASIYPIFGIFASEITRQLNRQQSDCDVPILKLVIVLQNTISAVALTGTWNAHLLHSCSLKEMCMVPSQSVKLHCFPYINTILGTAQWHYWRDSFNWIIYSCNITAQDAQVTLSRPLMTHQLHQKGEKPTFLLNTCTSGNFSYTQSPQYNFSYMY